MKKVIMSLALLLVGMAVNGQTVDKLIKKYKGKPGVELVHVNKTLMKLAVLAGENISLGSDKIDLGDDAKLDSLNVLTLEGGSDALKNEFVEEFSAIDFEGEGYDLLISTVENGEKVKIYAKKDGDICKEMLILACDSEDTSLVQLFGEIDLEKAMKQE